MLPIMRPAASAPPPARVRVWHLAGFAIVDDRKPLHLEPVSKVPAANHRRCLTAFEPNNGHSAPAPRTTPYAPKSDLQLAALGMRRFPTVFAPTAIYYY